MWGVALWVDVIIVTATDDVTSEFALPSFPSPSLYLSSLRYMLFMNYCSHAPNTEKLHENLTKLCLENVKTMENCLEIFKYFLYALLGCVRILVLVLVLVSPFTILIEWHKHSSADSQVCICKYVCVCVRVCVFVLEMTA